MTDSTTVQRMVRNLRRYVLTRDPACAIAFMDFPDAISRLSSLVLYRGENMRSQALTSHERQVVQDAIPYCDVDPFRPMECFRNAQELARGDLSGQLVYCEGVATKGRWPTVHHAWVCINGKVIDPTWERWPNDPRGGGVMSGVPPDGWAYRGIPFPTEVVRSHLEDYEEGAPLLASFMGGDRADNIAPAGRRPEP